MSSPRDIEREIVPFDPRHRLQNLLQQRRWWRNSVLAPDKRSVSFSFGDHHTREQLEQNAGGACRRQLELTVPLHRPGEWKERVQDVQAHHWSSTKGLDSTSSGRHRTWPDGSSPDRWSLDLRFHPWVTSKTVSGQYGPSGSWRTDSVHAVRPIRISVHRAE